MRFYALGFALLALSLGCDDDDAEGGQDAARDGALVDASLDGARPDAARPDAARPDAAPDASADATADAQSPDGAPTDGGPTLCATDTECLDHAAPLRCPGVWRCDPDHTQPASTRGADGCDYTCADALPACDGDCPAAGDVCRPCPFSGACNAPEVCVPATEASRCTPEDLSRCEGLPADACVGRWTCETGQCAWACDDTSVCTRTAQCEDHPAPLRCLGAWRCDPEHIAPADHFGGDGCAYTCWGNVPTCDPGRVPCDGGLDCVPCPAGPLCPAPDVCLEAPSCEHPRSQCLADADCGGGRCLPVPSPGAPCVCVDSEPRPVLQPCEGPGSGCCEAADCAATAVCQGVGYDTQSAYCGGAQPPMENYCLDAQCQGDEDCGAGRICVPAGAFGFVVNTCVEAACRVDGECQQGEGGQCVPFLSHCNVRGFGCAYASDPCRSDAECPPGEFPQVCQLDLDGHGTACVDDPPRP